MESGHPDGETLRAALILAVEQLAGSRPISELAELVWKAGEERS